MNRQLSGVEVVVHVRCLVVVVIVVVIVVVVVVVNTSYLPATGRTTVVRRILNAVRVVTATSRPQSVYNGTLRSSDSTASFYVVSHKRAGIHLPVL